MNWFLRTVIMVIVAGLAARGAVSIAHDGSPPEPRDPREDWWS